MAEISLINNGCSRYHAIPRVSALLLAKPQRGFPSDDRVSYISSFALDHTKQNINENQDCKDQPLLVLQTSPVRHHQGIVSSDSQSRQYKHHSKRQLPFVLHQAEVLKSL